jgi:hypothetical protein
MTLDKPSLEEIAEIARDPERNKLNLPHNTIRNRVRRLGWDMDRALNTPRMTRTEAARIAARNPLWRNFTIKETKHESPV